MHVRFAQAICLYLIELVGLIDYFSPPEAPIIPILLHDIVHLSDDLVNIVNIAGGPILFSKLGHVLMHVIID